MADGSGARAQKAGPIPLGDECGAAGLSTGTPPPATCPEGGIATNDDGVTQVSQAQDQLWGAVDTEINQTYTSEAAPELHVGAAYWVIGTRSFDRFGIFSLTSQGYVSAGTRTWNSRPWPRKDALAGRRQRRSHHGLHAVRQRRTDRSRQRRLLSQHRLRPADQHLGRPAGTGPRSRPGPVAQDGFTEYQGYPGSTRPRWGDYSWAIFAPWSGGKIYFATNYIQYPNCTGSAFTLTAGTCGGTRDGFANWGTSVNYVVP